MALGSTLTPHEESTDPGDLQGTWVIEKGQLGGGEKLSSLLDRMTRGILVADGAMGSMIARAFAHEKPLALARTLLEVNLKNPEVVHSIHLSYIAAGADVIETNTFGSSRSRLDRLGLGDSAVRVVSEAVKIAREARDAGGRPVSIAGSISPLDADWILDVNPDTATQAREFEAQAELLLDRGADLLILETFSRLPELLLALEAVRREVLHRYYRLAST